LVRHKFLQALPPMIGTALGAQKSLTLTEMGTMADELVPMQGNQINSVPYENSGPRDFEYSYPMEQEINYVRNQNYQVNSSNRFNNRTNNSTFFPIGLRPFNDSQRQMICRAHIYYAEKARSCKPWCKFPNKSPRLNFDNSSRSSSPNRSEN